MQGDNATNPRCDWNCPGGSYPTGYQSYGILQVKRTSGLGSYPLSQQSTGFNAAYAMAVVRHFYDGASWLGAGTAGDFGDAIGAYYCGCANAGSSAYTSRVTLYYIFKPWRSPGQPTPTATMMPSATGSAQPTQTPTATLTPTATPTPPPVTGNCLGAPAYGEIRSANTTANYTPGASVDPSYRQSWNPGFDAYLAKVTGQGCLGSTEQILEWAAKKWGFDELGYLDIAKAMAVQESTWYQATQGDSQAGTCDWNCPGGSYPTGYQSYGILQVKRTSWPGRYPLFQRSAAFRALYSLPARRSSDLGASWLGAGTAGDFGDAIGAYY